jgi:hypothetical protein
MHYPKWFPYPVCWLKSLTLLVYLGLTLRVTVFWGAVGTIASYDPLPTVLGMCLPFVLLAVTHHICIAAKSKSDWLLRWSSWQTAINAVIVAVAAILFAFAIVLPFCDDPYHPSQEVINWFMGLTWFFAAYLYHYDYLVRQARKRRRLAKAKSAAS